MSTNEIIPVFYACDDSFVNYTIVSIQSLMEHASRNFKYVIHILHTHISEDKKQVLSDMAGENFEVRFDDVTDYLMSVREKLPLRDYYSHTTYFRLFIAEMFPEYDKAVYLDSDTVVLGDISRMYCHDLGGNYVAAAPDQVIIQIGRYGDYAEKVLGINRKECFNAGVLLINCRLFREKKMLDAFVELLHTYTFVVAQDEDYLNLLCRGRVLWLDQTWNTQAFGKIPYPESAFNILHYNLAEKPWHYEDCPYGAYFWEYAKKTAIYEEIRRTLADYTDEEREADRLSGDRLYQLAKDEIDRDDNYLKLLNSGKLKSHDRLIVLDRIAKLESEGRFDEDVEEDPPSKELKPEDIDYLRKKPSSKLKTRLTYKAARKFLNNIIDEKKLIIKEIRGIEHFRDLNTGAIITCNHFNAFDSFAMQVAYEASGQKKRKLYRVIREGNYTNFPGFYGMLMRNCYTFPLSSNIETMKKFIESLGIVLKKGHFVLFYPEQSMWWNYRKPKPLKNGAFKFAVQNNVPVLPCFITMEDSDILGEDGFYVQEYTIHVSEPIYPDSRRSAKENIAAMQQKNYDVWKRIYEETYHEPLSYTCDEYKHKAQ